MADDFYYEKQQEHLAQEEADASGYGEHIGDMQRDAKAARHFKERENARVLADVENLSELGRLSDLQGLQADGTDDPPNAELEPRDDLVEAVKRVYKESEEEVAAREYSTEELRLAKIERKKIDIAMRDVRLKKAKTYKQEEILAELELEISDELQKIDELTEQQLEAKYAEVQKEAKALQKQVHALGNRTCSADPMWAFLSVRRTHDMINESIENAYLWAIDRPISPQLLLDMADMISADLRRWKSLGALIGGTAWLDPELNTVQTLMAGQVSVDYDGEGPAPMERATFRSHRNPNYYENLMLAVSAAA